MASSYVVLGVISERTIACRTSNAPRAAARLKPACRRLSAATARRGGNTSRRPLRRRLLPRCRPRSCPPSQNRPGRLLLLHFVLQFPLLPLNLLFQSHLLRPLPPTSRLSFRHRLLPRRRHSLDHHNLRRNLHRRCLRNHSLRSLHNRNRRRQWSQHHLLRRLRRSPNGSCGAAHPKLHAALLIRSAALRPLMLKGTLTSPWARAW